MEVEETKTKSDSDMIGADREEEEAELDDEDQLSKEMISVAGGEDYVGSLDILEIIFTHIDSLSSLKNCHNLIELNLIQTSTSSLLGIEV